MSGITAFSLFRSHPELQAAGFDVELGMLLGDCHVDDARNSLARDFLASRCDDLVFVDADIGFQSRDLIRLLTHDCDVVGGAYPKKSDIDEYPVALFPGEQRARNGLLEVRGIATGFLRISRKAMQTLWDQSAEYAVRGDNQAPCRTIFERLIVNGARMSGDMAFCHKWREAGGKVYADPECYLEHRGEKSWTGTLGSYLRKSNGIALVNGIRRIQAGTETDTDYFDLMLEWGNDGWAAGPELLKACVMVARQCKGAALEAGSGLTTLVMAAANPHLKVYALEHNRGWSERLKGEAHRLGIDNIVVVDAPLVQYPAGRWYDLPWLPWHEFDLVLCDGPPRADANRRILWGVMATKDCRPRCILVDDAETEGDAVPPEYRTEIKGELRRFAVGLRN